MREEYRLKNLRKVERPGCDLDRVLMADDESHKLGKNYGNHAPVTPFAVASDDSRATRTWPFPAGKAALAPQRIGS